MALALFDFYTACSRAELPIKVSKLLAIASSNHFMQIFVFMKK